MNFPVILLGTTLILMDPIKLSGKLIAITHKMAGVYITACNKIDLVMHH